MQQRPIKWQRTNLSESAAHPFGTWYSLTAAHAPRVPQAPSYLGPGQRNEEGSQVRSPQRRVLLSLLLTGSAAPSSVFEGYCNIFHETTSPSQCQTSRSLTASTQLHGDGAKKSSVSRGGAGGGQEGEGERGGGGRQSTDPTLKLNRKPLP